MKCACYYQVQIATGERREFSLNRYPNEVPQQATAMDAVIEAPNKEVALTHSAYVWILKNQSSMQSICKADLTNAILRKFFVCWGMDYVFLLFIK